MNSKERMQMLFEGKLPDRVGRADAPWPETRARWHAEGIPADTHANDYFELDIRRMLKIDTSFGFEEKVEEETEEYRVMRTADGNLEKYWKGTGVPQTLEHGLKNADDWQELKERLTAAPDRVALGYYGDYAHEYTAGSFEDVKSAWDDFGEKDTTFVPISVPDPYEGFMAKIGDEHILMMMALEPELIADMFDTHVKLACDMLDLAFDRGFTPDGVFVGGDIAYKNGLLFGPKVYRELVMPRHTAMFKHFHDRGLRIMYHTDGDCRDALAMLIEAGIDIIQPMECTAGMDIHEVGPQYKGQVGFMGNISVPILGSDPDRIREEVRAKVTCAVENRLPYIFHSDHSVPPQVTLANYQAAIEVLDECGNY